MGIVSSKPERRWPGRRIPFVMLGAFSQFERAKIIERPLQSAASVQTADCLSLPLSAVRLCSHARTARPVSHSSALRSIRGLMQVFDNFPRLRQAAYTLNRFHEARLSNTGDI